MTMLLFFEVMDKEPALSVLWGVFLFFGLLGLFLALLRPYLALIGLSGVVLYALLMIDEIHDPYIEPYIWLEAPNYIPFAYAAMAIGFLLPFLGAAYRMRKNLRNSL